MLPLINAESLSFIYYRSILPDFPISQLHSLQYPQFPKYYLYYQMHSFIITLMLHSINPMLKIIYYIKIIKIIFLQSPHLNLIAESFDNTIEFILINYGKSLNFNVDGNLNIG